MTKKRYRQLALGLITPVVLLTAAYIGLHQVAGPSERTIETQAPTTSFSEGTASGDRIGAADTLSTAGTLNYESKPGPTGQANTSAVVLQWDQQDAAVPADTEPVAAEIRTFRSGAWSNWAELEDTDDQKDGPQDATHSGIFLTKDATQYQYRFTVKGSGTQATTVSNPKVVAIDASNGPDPTKPKSGLAKFLGGDAHAATGAGPRVFSRAEWGCPEATSSPRWNPDYYTLNRVMVHHTAGDDGGYNGPAAVGSIWSYHANTKGWGDIGYNYLVDQYGNIYQGRYYDQNYADATKQVVMAGHTFRFNDESIGIAGMGNFQNEGPSAAMNESIAHIAGYKMAERNLDPWSVYSDEGIPGEDPEARGPRAQTRLAGHRNYRSTACPGNNLYRVLDAIRSRARDYVAAYGVQRMFDYSYQGQGINGVGGQGVYNLRNGQTATFYVDLKNEGEHGWQKSGPNVMRLGTANPFDRGSGFARNWAGPNRTGTFSGKVVNGTLDTSPTIIQPGETARFIFEVQNPNLSGSFKEFFQPVIENYTRFPRYIGVNWTINAVPDTYSGQQLDQSYTVPQTPNTAGQLTLTVKNTGNMTWNKSGGTDVVTLGTDRPMNRASQLQHSSWVSSSRVGVFAGRAQLGSDGKPVKVNGVVQYDNTATTIAPGEAAHWVFQVQTPNATYAGQEFFRPLIEGKTWFNDTGIWWPVDVTTGYRAQFAGQSAAPTITKSVNPIGTMYFDFTNTGGIAWTKSGSNPVRFGTERPKDRGSGFATFGLSGGSSPALPANTTNWLSSGRVGSFSGTVSGGTLDSSDVTVEPGETARFIIPLDARNIPAGQYPEFFSPLVEGMGWLHFGTWLPITVQN